LSNSVLETFTRLSNRESSLRTVTVIAMSSPRYDLFTNSDYSLSFCQYARITINCLVCDQPVIFMTQSSSVAEAAGCDYPLALSRDRYTLAGGYLETSRPNRIQDISVVESTVGI
jgi:hypothetical protein